MTSLVATNSAAFAAPPAKSAIPDTAKLAGSLASQPITWEGCTFSEELPVDVRELLENWENLQCATVKVPQDWHNPTNGKTFDLRISYVKNVDQNSSAYESTILVNPGGPGGEGVHWSAGILRRAPELAANFNTLGIDPRGVGQSETPQCLTFIDTDVPMTGKDVAKIVGESCSTNEAATKITSEQTAYDFDFVRGLLGIPKITYIGYSYGTWLGTWYGTLFGPNIDRMILDSSLDGTDSTLQAGWDLQPVARDRQFNDAMLPYAARIFEAQSKEFEYDPSDPRAYQPTTTEGVEEMYWEGYEIMREQDPELPGLVWALAGGMAAFPDPTYYPMAAATISIFIEQAIYARMASGEIPVSDADKTASASSASVLEVQAIMNATTTAERREAVSNAIDARIPLDQRAAMQPIRDAIDAAVDQAAGIQLANAYSAFDAIRCGDGQWTQGETYWDAWLTDMNAKAPFNAMFLEQLYPACAFWPTTNPTKPAADKKTFPPTLVIQGEEDSQTGYEGGLASGTKLPNTTFIAIDNATKHGYFPYRTSCVDDPAFSFLYGGKLKNKTVICQAKPLPGDTQTYEMWSPINVNGKHVPGKGTIPSRVQDPETGISDWDVSAEIAQAEAKLAVELALAHSQY